MATEKQDTVAGLILKRRGLVFLSSSGSVSEDQVRTVEIELAALGYVPSTRLHARMLKCTLDELVAFHRWVSAVLLAAVGADRKHEPLFRCFPERVPDDTLELWWQKVLVHFLQADRQPCLFCRKTGTTHVLNPCRHVVCDQCFDGVNYSACPVCEHHVDRSSPFFQEGGGRGIPSERVILKLIDLGQSLLDETRALFVSLCERKQALSPSDREALATIVRERRTDVLSWLPELIPVRENVAIVFGTLAQLCDPSVVLTHAKRYMTTATDVLRFIAVFSGADGSLSPETVFKTIERLEEPSRFWGRIAKLLAAAPPGRRLSRVTVPIHVCRFKVAKLKRPVRRSLLSGRRKII